MPPEPVVEREARSEVEACAECEGRGWVLEADGGAGTARPCDCRRAGLSPRLLAGAGIPARYRGSTLENFKLHGSAAEQEQQLGARRRSQQYVERFLTDDGGFAESGLIYVGATGVGKTHLAVAVLKELIQRYAVRGRFVDFTTLLFEIQSTFEPGSAVGKSSLLSPVTDAEVLVLDDLGAQKPSSWVNEVLYLVLNTRYASKLPTLFTTNYSLDFASSTSASAGTGIHESSDMVKAPGPVGGSKLDPLGSRISHRLVSRLYEMADVVAIEVPDFRQEVKVHQHRV